jgi:hypothetical protein
MTAQDIIRRARRVGVQISIVGNDLVLEAPAEPPRDLLDALARYKAEILAMLAAGADEWTAEDWQVFFEERAAVAEHVRGLPRDQAEAQAFDACVSEWLDRNPEPSFPGRCAACGGPGSAGTPLTPVGTHPGRQAWLHDACWEGWARRRREVAKAELQKRVPSGQPNCGPTPSTSPLHPIRSDA